MEILLDVSRMFLLTLSKNLTITLRQRFVITLRQRFVITLQQRLVITLQEGFVMALHNTIPSNRVNMGGVVTRVKSTVYMYVVDKRNQRNFVGYACLLRRLSTSHGCRLHPCLLYLLLPSNLRTREMLFISFICQFTRPGSPSRSLPLPIPDLLELEVSET